MKARFIHHFTTGVRLSLLLLLFGSGKTVYAQQYNIDWANCIGTTDHDDYARYIVTDNDGFVYIAGSIIDTTDMDPGPSDFFLNGPTDFVAKYDQSGSFIWARSFSPDRVLVDRGGLALDTGGNIIVTSGFSGTQDFDPGTGVHNLTSNGNKDVYILKLDPAGNFIWAKSLGGSGADFGSGLAVDPLNNIIIAGYNGVSSAAIDFDPNAGVASLSSSNGISTFILKLTSDGDYIWAKKTNNAPGGFLRANIALDVAVDEAGNVIFSGQISNSSPVDFDPGPGVFTIQGNGSLAVFVCKFDSSGNFNWAKQFAEGHVTQFGALTSDQYGNSYLALYIAGTPTTIDVDPGPGTYNLTTNGSPDVFLVKLDTAGDFSWAKQFGGEGPDYPTDCFYKNGNLYITGSYVSVSGGTGSVDFDPGPGSFPITNPLGNGHFYMSVIDTAGNFVTATSMGANMEAIVTRYAKVTVTEEGTAYVTGGFRNLGTFGAPAVVDFDPGPAVVNVDYNGYEDIFMVRLEPCLINDTLTIAACDDYTFNGQTYTQTGVYSYMPPGTPGVCDSNHVLNLTVDTAPDTSVLVSGNMLIAQASNVSYQWVDCNNGNTPIVGATNASFTPQQSGSYAVVLTGTVCTDTSLCHAITINGIEDVYGNSDYRIYPNPANDKVFITSLQDPFDNVTINLFGLNGQLVWSAGNVSGKEYILNMRSHAPGLYFVELRTKGNVHRVKLIKN